MKFHHLSPFSSLWFRIANLAVAMTTYLTTPPSYDLSVWPPQPTNDLYELWSLYSECPPDLPLLTSDFLTELHNNDDAGLMDAILEPNPFDNRGTPPVPNLPHGTPPPEPSPPYDTSISQSNQFHGTPSVSPPLQIAQHILESQDESKVNFTGRSGIPDLNSTKAEESIDFEEDERKLPHDEKKEEQPEKSTGLFYFFRSSNSWRFPFEPTES